jgi:hypothetical protein
MSGMEDGDRITIKNPLIGYEVVELLDSCGMIIEKYV